MKIIAVGKNYADHALEFDGTVQRPSVPMIFMKPDSAILKNGKPFFVPDFLGRVEYEAEIVVRISNLGKNIPTRFAHRYYDAVTVGIDFTARDWQRQLIAEGAPWELSKGFDGAATLGEFVPTEGLDVNNLSFRLDIDGEIVQSSNSSNMLFSIDEIVNYVSKYCTLRTEKVLDFYIR